MPFLIVRVAILVSIFLLVMSFIKNGNILTGGTILKVY